MTGNEAFEIELKALQESHRRIMELMRQAEAKLNAQSEEIIELRKANWKLTEEILKGAFGAKKP